jgi:hypothetical protein
MTPTVRIAIVPAKPMAIEIRPPTAMRVKRSRPNLSVPNGWSRLAGRYASLKFTAFGSCGETNGTTTQ